VSKHSTRRVAAWVALPALALGWTLLAGAVPAAAAAQTRYVATTGSDGTDPVNDCTVQAQPCRTIAHAVGEAAAGDTVSVAAGTYPEAVAISKSITVTGAGPAATLVTGNRATASRARR
jgi:nitrous oxidase accessory protein NosD